MLQVQLCEKLFYCHFKVDFQCHMLWSFKVDFQCHMLWSSFLKPLNRFGPNLAEIFIGRFSTRFVILVQIGNPTWLPGPIMYSDWLKFWKSSCQKLLSQWNCNIIEIMTGWSSTKLIIFVPITYPRWPPWLDLV
jgi:hypothetical protein